MRAVPVGLLQSPPALRHGQHTMGSFRWWLLLLSVFLCSSWLLHGLKCRGAAESQQGNDFEYVVRMCLRHMRNESDMFDFYRIQSDYDTGRNKGHRDEMSGDNNSNNNNNNNNNDNRNYYSRNRGYPEGFDRFWPSSNNPHDRNRYSGGDDDRNRQENDYEDPDFGQPRNGKDGRKKYKNRSQVPHSYQQQLQHDRDVLYGRGNRDSSYFYTNRNRNTKVMFNRENNNESPLADIDACVIHCIFQEMQMVDDNGKPNKGLISQKMTQKIRNSELKNFIQESVNECFDAIDDDDFGISYNGNNKNNNNNNNNNNNYNGNSNNRYRKSEMACEWAKAFAMCLENRGRDNCDDWNEPIQKNQHNIGNHGNSKNNEDQRYKSKQNERG